VSVLAGQARSAHIRAAASDTVQVSLRNLRVLRRSPQALIFATVQPIIFVLLFRYAFGGAIHVRGVR
jgi:ABC-2 type transport system permease protein